MRKNVMKRGLSLLLIVAMLASMFSMVGVATDTTATGGTLQVRSVWLNNGSVEENTDEALTTQISTVPGMVSPYRFYYVDANGEKAIVPVEDLKITSDVISIEAAGEDTDGTTALIGASAFGEGTISYGDSTVKVTTELPSFGLYTSSTADEDSYVMGTPKVKTKDVLYFINKDDALATDIAVSDNLSAIADVDIQSNYIQFTFTGAPEENDMYEITWDNGNCGYSFRLTDNNPGLKYRNVSYENNQLVEDTSWPLWGAMSLTPGRDYSFFFYFVENGTETLVTAADLTVKDESIATISANQENSNAVNLSTLDFGSTVVSYTKGEDTYELTLECVLPDFGCYAANSATEENYLTKFSYKAGVNTFYMISTSFTIQKVELADDFAAFASATLSADGKVVTITLDEAPASAQYYGVTISATNEFGDTMEMGDAVYIEDGRPGIRYVYANQDMDSVYESEGGMNSLIEIAPTFPMQGYFYFVEGDEKTRIDPSDLEVSDSKFSVSVHPLDSNVAIISGEDFGTGTVSYTAADGTVYTMNIVCDLPDIGFYTTSTPAQASYINAVNGYEVKAGDKFYIVVHNGMLVNAALEGEFEDIADLEMSQDGTYATITVTEAPTSDAFYMISSEWEGDSFGGRGGQSIYLKNGESRVAFRYPGMMGEEDPSGSLVNALVTYPGFVGEGYFYAVIDGVETRLSYDQLKSSDESIITVDEGFADNTVMFTVKGFGEAELSYSDNAGTYKMPVKSVLPNFAFYTEPVASESAFITECTLTDDTKTVIYLAAAPEYVLTDVSCDESIASCVISDDGTYATVTITGDPSNSMLPVICYYALASNTDLTGEEWVTISLINHRTYGTCGENAAWKIENGVLTISGSGAMNTYSSAWRENNVNKIVVAEGITTICDWAFANMEGVTEVSLPSTLTSLGYQSFFATGLKSVVIPDSVTDLGYEVFANCRSLTTVVLSDNIENVGFGIFTDCGALTSVKLPANATRIGVNTFYGCTSLKEITIPDGLVTIDENAFTATGLTHIVLPESVVELGINCLGFDADGNVNSDFRICSGSEEAEFYADANGMKFGHDLVKLTGKDATCSAAGITEGEKCTACGTIVTAQKEIPALGHKLTAVAEKAATYTAAGTKAHWVCSGCGTLFADAAGKTATTAAALVIPQLVKVEEGSADVREEAVEEAVKDAANSDTVELPLTDAGENVTAAEIPVAAVETVVEAKKPLVIVTEEAVITLDTEALKTIVDAAGETEKITIVVEKTEETALNAKQQEAVKEHEVVHVISAEIVCNGKNVHDFKGGVVSVQIPFTPEQGTEGSDYTIIYIADDGSIELVETSYKDGHLMADLKHFSEYAIIKNALPEMNFVDVQEGAWYYDKVEYVYQKGLMYGTGDGTTFDPSGVMTRAMLVCVLYRNEGSPEAGESKFTDLTQNWYKKAVAWAAENGIVAGTGDTTFSPDEAVTREQIATIMYRYAKYKGIDVSKSGDISSFPDAGDVHSWAETATKWAVGTGLISGKKNDGVVSLAPRDGGSRAEVATILKGFIQNVA